LHNKHQLDHFLKYKINVFKVFIHENIAQTVISSQYCILWVPHFIHSICISKNNGWVKECRLYMVHKPNCTLFYFCRNVFQIILSVLQGSPHIAKIGWLDFYLSWPEGKSGRLLKIDQSFNVSFSTTACPP
jgi:hypothetical protein